MDFLLFMGMWVCLCECLLNIDMPGGLLEVLPPTSCERKYACFLSQSWGFQLLLDFHGTLTAVFLDDELSLLIYQYHILCCFQWGLNKYFYRTNCKTNVHGYNRIRVSVFCWACNLPRNLNVLQLPPPPPWVKSLKLEPHPPLESDDDGSSQCLYCPNDVQKETNQAANALFIDHLPPPAVILLHLSISLQASSLKVMCCCN